MGKALVGSRTRDLSHAAILPLSIRVILDATLTHSLLNANITSQSNTALSMQQYMCLIEYKLHIDITNKGKTLDMLNYGPNSQSALNFSSLFVCMGVNGSNVL